VQTVIAIMPKVAAGESSAMPFSSKVPLAGQAATQSFSAVLERANPSPSESRGSQQRLKQATVPGNYSRVGDTSTREVEPANAKTADAKTADTKTSDSKTPESKAKDSQSRGNATIQTSAPSHDGSNQSAPIAAAQPTLSQALPWDAGLKNFAFDALIHTVAPSDAVTFFSASGGAAIPKPDATPALPVSQAISEDVIPAEPQTGVPTTDSGNSGSANSNDAGAVAGVVTDRSDATAVDSKTQAGNAPLVLHNPSRDPVEIAESANKTKAAIAPEPSQVVVAATLVPPLIPPVLLAPMPVRDLSQVDLGSPKGARDKSVTEKSRISATQDSAGTPGNYVEMTGETKTQPRKDDSPSLASSPATDPSTDSAPLKTIDLSSTFSAVGTQPSTISGDGKSPSDVVPTPGSGQQPGQLEQNSTLVAETEGPIETTVVYPTSPVQSAKLVERIGEAELRLGIRAGEFGSVDIRTSMVRNQFSAEISVERGELGRVMAAELPSLQSRLTEQGVPVASITVQNHSGSSSSASDQREPRERQQQYATNLLSGRDEGPMPALIAFEGTALASRLDIHM